MARARRIRGRATVESWITDQGGRQDAADTLRFFPPDDLPTEFLLQIADEVREELGSHGWAGVRADIRRRLGMTEHQAAAWFHQEIGIPPEPWMLGYPCYPPQEDVL